MQNYIRGRTSLVVAATMDDLRTRNLANTAKVDIANYNYLFQCETAGRLLKMRPTYLLAKSPETMEQFAAAFDEHGDAYYEEVTIDALRQILETRSVADRAAEVPEANIEVLATHPRFGLGNAMAASLATGAASATQGA